MARMQPKQSKWLIASISDDIHFYMILKNFVCLRIEHSTFINTGVCRIIASPDVFVKLQIQGLLFALCTVLFDFVKNNLS